MYIIKITIQPYLGVYIISDSAHFMLIFLISKTSFFIV